MKKPEAKNLVTLSLKAAGFNWWGFPDTVPLAEKEKQEKVLSVAWKIIFKDHSKLNVFRARSVMTQCFHDTENIH
jgi:hypothetical protein